MDIIDSAYPDIRGFIFSFLFGLNKPSKFIDKYESLGLPIRKMLLTWYSMQLVCKRWKELTDNKLTFNFGHQFPLRRAIAIKSIEGVKSLLKKHRVNPYSNQFICMKEAVIVGDLNVYKILLEREMGEDNNQCLRQREFIQFIMKASTDLSFLELTWDKVSEGAKGDLFRIELLQKIVGSSLRNEEYCLFFLKRTKKKLEEEASGLRQLLTLQSIQFGKPNLFRALFEIRKPGDPISQWLYFATCYDNIEIAKLIIEEGDITESEWESISDTLIQKSQSALIFRILFKNPFFKPKERFVLNALSRAVFAKDSDQVRLFLSEDSSFNFIDYPIIMESILLHTLIYDLKEIREELLKKPEVLAIYEGSQRLRNYQSPSWGYQ